MSKEVAYRINELMMAKGMSGVDLARLTGLHTNTISNYRHGRYIPGGINAEKLARALNVSVAFLLCLTDDRYESPMKTPPPEHYSRQRTNTEKLFRAFDNLNDEGQMLAIHYVELLANAYSKSQK